MRGLQLYYAPVIAFPGVLCNILCLLCIMLQNRSSAHVYTTGLIFVETWQLILLLHTWATTMGVDM